MLHRPPPGCRTHFAWARSHVRHFHPELVSMSSPTPSRRAASWLVIHPSGGNAASLAIVQLSTKTLSADGPNPLDFYGSLEVRWAEFRAPERGDEGLLLTLFGAALLSRPHQQQQRRHDHDAQQHDHQRAADQRPGRVHLRKSFPDDDLSAAGDQE